MHPYKLGGRKCNNHGIGKALRTEGLSHEKGHIEGRKRIIATEKGMYTAERKDVTFDPAGFYFEV